MSSEGDINGLLREVAALRAEVKEIAGKTPEALAKQQEEDARKKAHEDRKEAFRAKNGIDPPRARNYINTERREVAIQRNNSNIVQQPEIATRRPVPPPKVVPTVYQSESHPWKVSRFSDAQGASATYQVKVIGGPVRTQGAFLPAAAITVADDPTFEVAETGYVLLNVTRDSTSRAITLAVLQWSATELESTETNQYFTLAYVTVGGTGIITAVSQKQFEDIIIFEDLAVMNGEFQMVSLSMKGQNPYAPPTP